MQESYTPTSARKNLYQLLKQVAEEHRPITIQQKDAALDTVIVPKDDWDAIQETLYLYQTGTLAKVAERENDQSGTTNIDDIDWDNL
ncbi:type II toxin-antitoxin system Phd/YefM family antitoxin [Lactiplantibacillus modestisalitolerans]|uniref:Antitoxin n=1 Tax=Lactiplantibacillus modestisalitolerans TaxID=1457219 RepID=A0ABV5WST4_9LACO|nr:type II toxin-antitoxin system Phd/YefM family antitoxin [Lactiplantibacillus modestisalitolerans]